MDATNKNNADKINNRNTSSQGLVLVIIAGVCWGCISLFIKNLGAIGYGSFQIMLMRTLMAVVFLGLFLLFYDKKLFVISYKDIWMFVGTGIVSLTFFSYCYFTTMVRSGAAVAVVLLYTSPIFVMLMSAVFFKESITVRKLVALFMTIGGCMLMAGLVGGEAIYAVDSIIMGLLSGFGYALYSIFAAVALKKYSPLTVTFYTLLFSTVSVLFMPGINCAELFKTLELRSGLLFAGAALICTVVSYVTYTMGLARMEKSKAAILVTVEPMVGTLIGIFVFHEPVTVFGVLGMSCIFLAVVLLV